jgi:protein-ribulosamine 3-kinase
VTVWAAIAAQIGALTGAPFAPAAPHAVSGGCINTTVRLADDGQSWFVKVNAASMIDMFEAERAGLEEIASAGAIRVPRPLAVGCAGAQSWLVLEDIRFGRPGPGSAREAGRRLAALHRRTASAFGWSRDNTIGATSQPNDWTASWRDRRLGHQLRLAARSGYGGRLQALGDRVMERLPALLDHAPEPSLLHGDLWGGNIGFTTGGEPVIFDPAVYYGDREADLAMTELFGGFGAEFHAGYREAWPLDAGYATRKVLYNLYHVLNHLNLFGGGYGAQAEAMMARLLAEVR